MTTASIRRYWITTGGHELSGQPEDAGAFAIPDAAYQVDDGVWVDGRRLVVMGREWRDGELTVMCRERVVHQTKEQAA